MPLVSFDLCHFMKQLKRLYFTKCADKDLFAKVDYIICTNDLECSKRMEVQFMFWLFEVYFHNTTFIVGRKDAYILCGKDMLSNISLAFDDKALKQIEETIGLKVQIWLLEDNENNKPQFSRVIDLMKNHMKFNSIGVFQLCNDNNIVTNIEKIWYELFLENNLSFIDINESASYIMSMKDDSELEIMRQAFDLCVKTYLRSLDVISDFLRYGHFENHEFQTNDDIASTVKRLMTTERFTKLNDSKEAVDFYYSPVIQSGGSYNSVLTSGSNKEPFTTDVIILSFGIRYHHLCASITRTFVAYQNNIMEQNYLWLGKIRDFLLTLLQDGAKLSEVYENTLQYIQVKKPEFVENLTRNFGSVIGVLAEDQFFKITKKSTQIAKENMTFHITLSVNGLVDETKESMTSFPHKYSLRLGDIVKVEKEKPASLLAKIDMLTGKSFLRDRTSYRLV